MKKILVFFLFFTLYFNVYAIDNCTSGEMARLKELAKNVTFNYQFIVEEEIPSEEKVFGYYQIKVSNLHDDLKLYYKYSTSSDIIPITPLELSEVEFHSSKVPTFYIYSYTNNLCTDEIIRVQTLKLPVYNPYYHFNKEKCDNNLDFKYCQEFLDIKEKEFSEIDKLFNEYQKEQNKEDNNFNFFDQYKIYIIIITGILLVIVLLIIIYIFKRKNKEDI